MNQRFRRLTPKPSTYCFTSAIDASRRMSIRSALPPGRSTRRISRNAFSGSVKFLKAARQTTKSTLASSSGKAAALPSSKRTSTPSAAALLRAMSTNVLLMSSARTGKPRLASSIERKPGPGATSSTCADDGIAAAMRIARDLISGRSFRVVRSYQRAVLPSMPIPLYAFTVAAIYLSSMYLIY